MTDFKKFQNFINEKSKQWGVNLDDIYFSQTRDGYYADYKVDYPNRNLNTDWVIFRDLLTGETKCYGNFNCPVPTITIIE